MQEKMYGEFIVKIMETLSKNGFPEKKVALPLEKLYESAADKGLSFNKVLEFLREKGIDHNKTTEKIIFYARQSETVESKEGFAMDDLMGMAAGFMGGVNLNDMMMKAQEMLKNMSPEQKEAIQSMYQGMSEEEKQSILKKAKDMGLF